MAKGAILFSHASVDRFFGRYKFSYITEKSGLPHCFVDDVFRDSDGYIWMATHQGIARYDGYQYLTYDTQTAVKLKSDFVHKICEDNFRRLWIASEGGIDILDLRTYSLASLTLPADSPLHKMMTSYINTLYKDGKGDLWISCNNALWCIELNAKGEIHTYHCLEQEELLPVQGIVDVHGRVCAGINNEVCSLEKQADHRLKATPLSDSLTPYSKDWRISCMQVDKYQLWIGSNRGLFKYDLQSRELKRYRYSTHRPGMLSQAYITDIELTAGGNLIVSTLNGLNVYHPQSDTFSFIRQSGERDIPTLNCNAINCLLTDGETIWVGTETGGVNLLAPKRLQAEVWICPTRPIEPGSAVNTIAEDKEGHLWMGLPEKGLLKWDVDNNHCTRHLFSPNDTASISNNTLSGLMIDANNHLWAYTWGVGINMLDLNLPGNTRFRRYTREERASLEGDFISSACEDPINKGYWFGTTRGVHFYDKQKDVFVRLQFGESDNEFEAVNALLIDRKNRLWIGTTEGVFVVDILSFARSRRNFYYTYLKYKLDNSSSTQLEKINSIFEDRNGTIWLGGNGSGLYKLHADHRNDRFSFSNYTVRNGLPGNSITGICEDTSGNLWLTTTEGLSRLDTKTMTFSNFTQTDGLPSTRFYLNGIRYSAKHNRLYLATADGLLMVHADKESAPFADPQVKLTSLIVGTEPAFPAGGRYLEEDITHARRISLHESESRFSVGLTTQNYGNSARIRFAYRLKGYEQEWNETKPGGYMARYNFVPPGNYTLQVRATDEAGHWSQQATEVEVKVAPYFYKSVWFFLLMAVLASLSARIFYRWKTKNYRERNLRLEKKVEQRTQELTERNAQLEDMARHVREMTEEKIAFFTNITHEFRTPVTLIHGLIKHTLREVEDERAREQLRITERNSRYLLSLINELMDFRKLDADKVTLDLQACRFPAFLSELLLPFSVFARERDIEIRTFYRLSSPFLMIDEGYMRKAMGNLLSNAIKFMPDGGHIDLYVASVHNARQEELLYINVSDTGHGIAEDETEKIFDRFYQSRQTVKYPVYGQSGTGIGLFLCRKIIELHGGTISAHNNHRQGASFRILMPLVRAEEVADVTPLTPSPEATTEETPPESNTKRETILVVEDNKDMRSYICTLLGKEYHLLQAGNGEEALRQLQKHAVDMVVSDLMMPVMDGMELSRRVKENISTSHIPFLMLTAIRSEAQEKKSFEVGVDEYLCKPFDEEVLRLRIRNILNLRNRYKKMFSISSNVEELHIKEESHDKTFIATAIGLMEKNYADADYNLECFVRDMGYSKTLVNSKMQDLTGLSIGRFMKSYRLNVAQRMIREGAESLNVSEVAYAVGFNDPKYFTKCFKEQFGCLPGSLIRAPR